MKRLPIKAARLVAQAYGLSQVIIIARGPTHDHVVTWGKTKEDCEEAANGGNSLKRYMKWPEHLCHSKPWRLGGKG